MKVLAIDLGGTSAKIGLFNGDVIEKTWQVPTVIEDIWGNIRNYLVDLNWNEIEAIGLSVPGFADSEKGIIKLAGNLNWKDYDVKSDFKTFFNKPVYVLNDANAAALAELWQGAGVNRKNFILYTIGTGIGGGLIMGGDLVTGVKGFAGELGHGGNFQNIYKCSCGLKGCIEPMSSATGINKALKENGFDVTVKDAKKLIEINPKIRKVFKDALLPLALHIVVMECALNPELVIIGGGPSNDGENIRQIIEENVKENQLPFVEKSTKIVLAKMGSESGMIGAAYWAIKNHKK